MKSRLLKTLIAAGAAVFASQTSEAAERGQGVYLLGLKGPMAGIVPAPGLYLQNDIYYYNGSTGAAGKLPSGDAVGVGVKASAVVELPTFIWSTPYEVLGGRTAFAVTAPVGHQSVNADLFLGSVSLDNRGAISTFGDPMLTAMVGWDSGNFHWNVSGMLNVPVGDYDRNSMANIAFNRWASDLSLAVTRLDPELGLDISGVVGFTFNGKNLDTDYRTGTELHLEGAISKAITPQFSVGAAGYYYQQISDDRPKTGVDLGGFRGRVAALGATASYTFEANKTPIMARVKLFREFHAENRQDGTAAFLTLLFPLHAGQ